MDGWLGVGRWVGRWTEDWMGRSGWINGWVGEWVGWMVGQLDLDSENPSFEQFHDSRHQCPTHTEYPRVSHHKYL